MWCPECERLMRILQRYPQCESSKVFALLDSLFGDRIKTVAQLKKILRNMITEDMLSAPFVGMDDIVNEWIKYSGMDKVLKPE